MLSSTQEQILADTAPIVAEHLETITARFYPLMFERYPEVNALFNASHQTSGNPHAYLPRHPAGPLNRCPICPTAAPTASP
ncbi:MULTISPECIES: hypothetical protein [Halomonadaceae]|jgi:hemoglobin-like flavoprotein|uniref:hypothetical protein n=1 Tax=Halomonadaceae TaxID=28256 RepID=UPI002573CC6B|nr:MULTISPECIES: hypothetical protein [Halomonas]